MHHGITNRIDPGPAVVGNGYEDEASAGVKLPNNWFAANDAFEASPLMNDYLGQRFVKNYTIVKRTEMARFYGEVTQLDYDWYLRNA